MNPLALIEKLIEEHGSSTIQTKHLSLLREEIAILQRKNAELQSENTALKEQVANAAPVDEPGDKCPYCRKFTGKLDKLEPHSEHLLQVMGIKVGHYTCQNKDCGKTYDKQIDP